MPPQQEPENLIIGQVVAPFGIKGEVKVTILTEFPDRFNKLEAVIIAPFNQEPAMRERGAEHTTPEAAPSEPTPAPKSKFAMRAPQPATPQGSSFRAPRTPAYINIESVRAHKGQALVKFKGVDNPETADLLRNYWVMIPIEQAHKLPKGAYYIYQLVGLDVYTTAGDLLGKLDEVLTTAANDIYIVRGPGITDPTGELLVPSVKHIVKKIDVEAGRITIVPPSEWS